MMAVVVDDGILLAAVLELEAPPRAAERLQRPRHRRERNAEFHGQGDDARGVADVVPAGDVQRRFAEQFAAPVHVEVRLEILGAQIFEAIVRPAARTERDRAWPAFAKPRGVHVVETVEGAAARAVEQAPENGFDGSEVRIIVEVFFFDVEEDGVLGFEQGHGAVAFVSLGDEVFAAGVPVGVRPEDRDFRADVVARPQTRPPAARARPSSWSSSCRASRRR